MVVTGEPLDPRLGDIGRGQGAERAPDHEPRQGFALGESPPRNDRRRWDRVPSAEGVLPRDVIDELGLFDAVSSEVDRLGAEPIDLPEPQPRQRSFRDGESRDEREVGVVLRLREVDVVPARVEDRLARSLHDQAPAVPAEDRLVEVEVVVGLVECRGGRGALHEALVVGLQDLVLGRAGRDHIAAVPARQRSPWLRAVHAPDVRPRATRDVLGEEVRGLVRDSICLVLGRLAELTHDCLVPLPLDDHEPPGPERRQGGLLGGHGRLARGNRLADLQDGPGEVERLECAPVDVELLHVEPVALEAKRTVDEHALLVARPRQEASVVDLIVRPGPSRFLARQLEAVRDGLDEQPDPAQVRGLRVQHEVDRQAQPPKEQRVVTQERHVPVEVDRRLALRQVNDLSGSIVEAPRLDEGHDVPLGGRHRPRRPVVAAAALDAGLHVLAEALFDLVVLRARVEADHTERAKTRQRRVFHGREGRRRRDGDVVVEARDLLRDARGREAANLPPREVLEAGGWFAGSGVRREDPHLHGIEQPLPEALVDRRCRRIEADPDLVRRRARGTARFLDQDGEGALAEQRLDRRRPGGKHREVAEWRGLVPAMREPGRHEDGDPGAVRADTVREARQDDGFGHANARA